MLVAGIYGCLGILEAKGKVVVVAFNTQLYGDFVYFLVNRPQASALQLFPARRVHQCLSGTLQPPADTS